MGIFRTHLYIYNPKGNLKLSEVFMVAFYYSPASSSDDLLTQSVSLEAVSHMSKKEYYSDDVY